MSIRGKSRINTDLLFRKQGVDKFLVEPAQQSRIHFFSLLIFPRLAEIIRFWSDSLDLLQHSSGQWSHFAEFFHNKMHRPHNKQAFAGRVAPSVKSPVRSSAEHACCQAYPGYFALHILTWLYSTYSLKSSYSLTRGNPEKEKITYFSYRLPLSSK